MTMVPVVAMDTDWVPKIQGAQEKEILLNDTANADRLVKLYGDRLAHCEKRNGFMVFMPELGAWRHDRFVVSEQMGEDTMRQELNKAADIKDSEERGRYLKFISSSLSRKGLENMTHLAKKKVRQVEIADFDRDPLLLNCRNGTIDLRNGELREHRKEDMLSKLIPIDFDPEAECPQFLRFLYRIMGDGPDAAEEERDRAARLVAHLQRLFGCAATAKPEKLLVIFHGESGNNGKSTLLNVISKALGDKEYSSQINIDSLMVDPKGNGTSNTVNTDMTDMQGARFVFSSEVERGQRLALSRVKYLTGLTAIKARRMREDFIEFPSTWKIFLDCNHRPVISSPTDPVWNRVRCIPFTVEIGPDEIDTDLPLKLEAELQGILAWIVQGAKDYVASGLGGTPQEVLASTAEYRESSDQLKDFIEDRCHLNKFAWVASESLSQAYAEWATKNGERHPLNSKTFFEQLKAKGCSAKIRSVHGKDRRGWLGIELKQE